jgi:hypothetical protein
VRDADRQLGERAFDRLVLTSGDHNDLDGGAQDLTHDPFDQRLSLNGSEQLVLRPEPGGSARRQNNRCNARH